jgi:hypothetical protein
MMKQYYALTLFILSIAACTGVKKEPSKCCTVKHSTSASMDTVTVVISGKIFECKNNRVIKKSTTIKLDGDYGTYETSTSPDGKFGFYHIPSGTYSVEVISEGYCHIKQKELTFGSGNIVDMVVYLTKK